jgi:hypothetical protein
MWCSAIYDNTDMQKNRATDAFVRTISLLAFAQHWPEHPRSVFTQSRQPGSISAIVSRRSEIILTTEPSFSRPVENTQ